VRLIWRKCGGALLDAFAMASKKIKLKIKVKTPTLAKNPQGWGAQSPRILLLQIVGLSLSNVWVPRPSLSFCEGCGLFPARHT
jgi:hypothetical protein